VQVVADRRSGDSGAAAAVTAAEFAGVMAGLGPFGASQRVAVAVSGGGDSMALAVLAAEWGRARAFIVDHGLRADSDAEAALTESHLAARGIPARILRLAELRPGPGLPARARTARYAALEAACAAEGFAHLLLGHQQGDQAETRLMRASAGSGAAGLAGMAAIVERTGVRLVRPLLGIPPGRLRATLRAAGVGWVEDPTNRDRRFLRPRLRAEIGAEAAALAVAAGAAGMVRAAREREVAAILAERVGFDEAGFALLALGPILPAALAAVLQAIAGAAYPPRSEAVAALAAEPRPATLAGARIVPAGRLGPGWLVLREQAAIGPAVAAHDGALWDGRFRLAGTAPSDTQIAALGADAARFRRASRLPAAILATLPALRRGGALVAIPHIEACAGLAFLPAPPRPATGAVFCAAAAPSNLR
jgi:tRNA(Ile)-lysidine synthase